MLNLSGEGLTNSVSRGIMMTVQKFFWGWNLRSFGLSKEHILERLEEILEKEELEFIELSTKQLSDLITRATEDVYSNIESMLE
jgi:hypothetical protein